MRAGYPEHLFFDVGAVFLTERDELLLFGVEFNQRAIVTVFVGGQRGEILALGFQQRRTSAGLMPGADADRGEHLLGGCVEVAELGELFIEIGKLALDGGDLRLAIVNSGEVGVEDFEIAALFAEQLAQRVGEAGVLEFFGGLLELVGEFVEAVGDRLGVVRKSVDFFGQVFAAIGQRGGFVG